MSEIRCHICGTTYRGVAVACLKTTFARKQIYRENENLLERVSCICSPSMFNLGRPIKQTNCILSNYESNLYVPARKTKKLLFVVQLYGGKEYSVNIATGHIRGKDVYDSFSKEEIVIGLKMLEEKQK